MNGVFCKLSLVFLFLILQESVQGICFNETTTNVVSNCLNIYHFSLLLVIYAYNILINGGVYVQN
jgi:hypothetical protein